MYDDVAKLCKEVNELDRRSRILEDSSEKENLFQQMTDLLEDAKKQLRRWNICGVSRKDKFPASLLTGLFVKLFRVLLKCEEFFRERRTQLLLVTA